MDFPRQQRPVGRRVLGSCGNRNLEEMGLSFKVGGDVGKREEFKENSGGIGNGAGMGRKVKELLLMGHFEEPPAVLEIGEDPEGMDEDWEEISLDKSFGKDEIELLKFKKVMKTAENEEDSADFLEEFGNIGNCEGIGEGGEHLVEEDDNEVPLEKNMSGMSLEEIEIEDFDEVAIEEILEGPEDGPGDFVESQGKLEGMKDDEEDTNEVIAEGGENPVEEDDDGMPKLGLAIVDQFQGHGEDSPPPVLQAEVTPEETKEDKNKCWICHRQFINPGVLASHVKVKHPQNFVKSLKKTEKKPKLADVKIQDPGTSSKRNPVPTSKLLEFTKNKTKISCSLCSRLFGNRGALGNHMKICHSEPKKNSEVIEAPPPPPPNPPKESDEKDTDTFLCVRCPFKTNSFNGLYQHVKMNHCVVCGCCKRLI